MSVSCCRRSIRLKKGSTSNPANAATTPTSNTAAIVGTGGGNITDDHHCMDSDYADDATHVTDRKKSDINQTDNEECK